jgi:hypothetical protein
VDAGFAAGGCYFAGVEAVFLKYGAYMGALIFDTLRFTRTLEKAGVPTEQAEAISTAFKEASGEAELATKRDIEKLEYKMDRLSDKIDKERSLVKWMMGVLLAGVISLVMKQFF